ncbi:hypothetical protein D5085_01095 [Ectothiorhodospiraceae bacterium BW-2]|nr:hypothetical protein D5085_01095 [Ectothiorhodospiraceae bacterium BW-2]
MEDISDLGLLSSANPILQQIRQTIPSAHQQAVSYYRYGNYPMLHLAALEPYAAQLLHVHPTFYWLWAGDIDRDQANWQQLVHKALQQKLHHLLLNWLGDSAAEWVKRSPKLAL